MQKIGFDDVTCYYDKKGCVLWQEQFFMEQSV